ncbi:hypothetical protein MBANPS3_009954 [Mucor bainieri]
MQTLMNICKQAATPTQTSLMQQKHNTRSTKQFNVLVTASLLLRPTSTEAASVGPSCHPALINEEMSFACLLVREAKKDEFLSQIGAKSTSQPTIDLENVRQLTTLPNHPSTYLAFRSHLVTTRLLYSATIFTLSKYPTRSYGMTSSNQTRLLSEFFKVFAECMVYNKGGMTREMIMQTRFAHFCQMFKVGYAPCHSTTKHARARRFEMPLKNKLDALTNVESVDVVSFVESWIEYTKNPNDVPRNVMRSLSSMKGLSTTCQSISSQISTANKKIATNLNDEFKKDNVSYISRQMLTLTLSFQNKMMLYLKI